MFNEIISKLVLESRLLVENCFRFNVKHTMITLVNNVGIDDAAVCKVFVDHVLLAQLQMKIFCPLVVVVENCSVDAERVLEAVHV